MNWDVGYPGRVRKQIEALPPEVRAALRFLARDIETLGPGRANWPSYGRIKGKTDCHHCHLQKGNPTYVAV